MAKTFEVSRKGSWDEPGLAVYGLSLFLSIAVFMYIGIDNVMTALIINALIILIAAGIVDMTGRAEGGTTLECTEDRLILRYSGKEKEMLLEEIQSVSVSLKSSASYKSGRVSYRLILDIVGLKDCADRQKMSFEEYTNARSIEQIVKEEWRGGTLLEIYEWIAERRPDIAGDFVKQRD